VGRRKEQEKGGDTIGYINSEKPFPEDLNEGQQQRK